MTTTQTDSGAFRKLGKLTLVSYPVILTALAQIRTASARANAKLGRLSEPVAQAIARAAAEVAKNDAELKDISIFGVLGRPFYFEFSQKTALRATQLCGHTITIEDVECNQATADITATLSNIIASEMLAKNARAAHTVSKALYQKATEFKDTIKCSRFSLQDSLPISLGREFEAMAHGFERIAALIESNQTLLNVSLLGSGESATALDIDEEFPDFVAQELSEIFKKHFVSEASSLDGLFAVDRLVFAHSCLKILAVHFWRVMHDFVLMTSGPRGGIREIALPAVAPGSSIMPGKVNPTMAQLGALIADSVNSADVAVSSSAQSGWLGEGMRQSTIIKALIDSGELLSRTMEKNIDKIIVGIKAQPDFSEKEAMNSAALLFIVKAVFGSEVAQRTATRMATDKTNCKEALKAEQLISEADADMLFDIHALANPGTNTQLIRQMRAKYLQQKAG